MKLAKGEVQGAAGIRRRALRHVWITNANVDMNTGGDDSSAVSLLNIIMNF